MTAGEANKVLHDFKFKWFILLRAAYLVQVTTSVRLITVVVSELVQIAFYVAIK